jgi:lambda family phage portal protein
MLTKFDKFTRLFAPGWTLNRVRARAAMDVLASHTAGKRHYEAASHGRRTEGWARTHGDQNAVARRALAELRMHARDLVRNNAWAKRARQVIANNVVGTGIVAKAKGDPAASAAWKEWAEATTCDSERRLTFYGIQSLVMKSIAESGEVLIRRRKRDPADKLPLNLQLQVLEADFLDTSKDGVQGSAGGLIVQGVEFDGIGNRIAYWIFPEHPGATTTTSIESKRIPASEIIHVFQTERPGQTRGVSWFGASIVNLKDFDEYEDATLMKQKIASCFAAFVVDMDGTQSALGATSTTTSNADVFEPGMIENLPPGKDVRFANPPSVSEYDAFTKATLRRIASGLGVTYEDLTNDYSQVNFSSARMSRLAHWANVRDWQWNMLIPLLCDGVWAWAMEAAQIAGKIKAPVKADWTAPPMPMIEPDKEGLAYQRLVRTGVMTHDEMVREQGGDPEAHWDEYGARLKDLKARGIQLDSNVADVSQAGLTQVRAGVGGGGGSDQQAQQAADPVVERFLELAERGLNNE